jgi:hypothetical protein
MYFFKQLKWVAFSKLFNRRKRKKNQMGHEHVQLLVLACSFTVYNTVISRVLKVF